MTRIDPAIMEAQRIASAAVYGRVRREAFTDENRREASRVTRTRIGDCVYFMLYGVDLGYAAPSRDGWIISGVLDGAKWVASVHHDGIALWLTANYRLGGTFR